MRISLKLFSYSKDTKIKYQHKIYLHNYTAYIMECCGVTAVCRSRRQRLTKKAAEVKTSTLRFLRDFPQICFLADHYAYEELVQASLHCLFFSFHRR